MSKTLSFLFASLCFSGLWASPLLYMGDRFALPKDKNISVEVVDASGSELHYLLRLDEYEHLAKANMVWVVKTQYAYYKQTELDQKFAGGLQDIIVLSVQTDLGVFFDLIEAQDSAVRVDWKLLRNVSRLLASLQVGSLKARHFKEDGRWRAHNAVLDSIALNFIELRQQVMGSVSEPAISAFRDLGYLVTGHVTNATLYSSPEMSQLIQEAVVNVRKKLPVYPAANWCNTKLLGYKGKN